MWVQLRLKHPVLGERHRVRLLAYEGASQEALHGILYRDKYEARVICECRGLLHGELTLAADQGVKTIAGLLSNAGITLAPSDCTRCLDTLAISLAHASGESPRLLREQAALVGGVHAASDAKTHQAYANLRDDVALESSEPELIYSVSDTTE